MFFNIDVLKNFVTFTGKHLCRSLFLITLQTFFDRTPPVAASAALNRTLAWAVFFCKFAAYFQNHFF